MYGSSHKDIVVAQSGMAVLLGSTGSDVADLHRREGRAYQASIVPWMCTRCGSKQTLRGKYDLLFNEFDVNCAGCGAFVKHTG